MNKETKFHKNYKRVRKEISKLTKSKSIIFGDLVIYNEDAYLFIAKIPFDHAWAGEPMYFSKEYLVKFTNNDFTLQEVNTEKAKEIIDIENKRDSLYKEIVTHRDALNMLERQRKDLFDTKKEVRKRLSLEEVERI